jgi:hypothetical protein
MISTHDDPTEPVIEVLSRPNWEALAQRGLFAVAPGLFFDRECFNNDESFGGIWIQLGFKTRSCGYRFHTCIGIAEVGVDDWEEREPTRAPNGGAWRRHWNNLQFSESQGVR